MHFDGVLGIHSFDLKDKNFLIFFKDIDQCPCQKDAWNLYTSLKGFSISENFVFGAKISLLF